MKYIKKFEKQDEIKYKIGDYVVPEPYTFTNILYDVIYITGINSNIEYQVQYLKKYHNGNKTLNTSYIFVSEVERIATKDEIAEFELLKNTIKYNL